MEATKSKSRTRETLLVGVLALALDLAGNGRVSPWDRDEPRYAGALAFDLTRPPEYLNLRSA